VNRRILPILALAAVAIAWARRRLVAYEIAERSMEPALAPGDWMLGLRTPLRLPTGAVVVYRDPSDPGLEIVKRVAPAPRALAAGELWLLGDNPHAGSVDSRTLGPIPREWVAARLFLRYHPGPPRFLLRNGP
jgi:hypothetical protein